MSRIAIVAVLALALASVSCGDDDTPTSPTNPIQQRGTEIFNGTLTRGELQFFSFATAIAGSTDVTLLSVRPAGVPTTALPAVMGLGLGQPQGTGCSLSNAMTTASALSAQLRVPTSVSTYCVAIS